MAKSYEELMGAMGRAMFFRPERKRVRDLFSRDANPSLRLDGREYPLHDLSMNGLSFFVAHHEAAAWPTGTEIDVTLTLHGARVYGGPARVARVEPSGIGTRVALALMRGFLDLPDVRRRDEEARLAAELAGDPAERLRRVPPGFGERLLEVSHFLQHYRLAFARHEARYRDEGEGSAEQLAALTARAADALRGRWIDLEGRASQAAAECMDDPIVLRAAKELTETLVTPLLLDCPMVRRSYTKPLGYPGDYQVMLYYYNNAFEGDSVFARVFHKFFVEHPLSNGVRTRKDHVVELMGRELERVAAARLGETYRVASLGCGPAREVADFIAARRRWPGAVEWTLIDQEEETLSVAYHAGRRALADTHAHGHLHCLNLSFGQLLQEPALLAAGPPQDFIYSTGLFDYLRESRAQALLATLYERLAPGGLLAIGNALAPNAWFFSPELILDWTLLYRTRDEMRRLAARLPAEAVVDVAPEPGNAYWFLLVRKP
jgi:AraC-like DNA-binding protein